VELAGRLEAIWQDQPVAERMETSTGPASIRTVVIDDELIVRHALHQLLGDSEIEIVGEASKGETGIAAVLDTAPDVAMVDLNLPDISGIEVTKRISTVAPASNIVILTASDAQRDVVDSIRAGAIGYVLKGAEPAEIVDGVRRVAAGEPVLSSNIVVRLLELIRAGKTRDFTAEDAATGARAILTEREWRILELLGQGKDNSAIADELDVSPYTVKNHVASILAKLQLENRVQAAVEAAHLGLV
jgi:DNA-binding NarL/FixJ family response regulator